MACDKKCITSALVNKSMLRNKHAFKENNIYEEGKAERFCEIGSYPPTYGKFGLD